MSALPSPSPSPSPSSPVSAVAPGGLDESFQRYSRAHASAAAELGKVIQLCEETIRTFANDPPTSWFIMSLRDIQDRKRRELSDLEFARRRVGRCARPDRERARLVQRVLDLAAAPKTIYL